MNTSSSPSDDELPAQPALLLVDDDEVNLLLTSAALRERGFLVTEATGGEQAIEMLSRWTPDVVVLDAMMPGLDGFATCRTLRHMPGCESMPVLMLTGLGDDASVKRAFEAGASDFFSKSTQWSLLAERLRFLLRSARTRQQLERNKARLARAQDLARMGSFDWKRGDGGPVFSVEGLRVFGIAPDVPLGFRVLLRMINAEERNGLLTILREVMRHSSVLATDVPVTLLDGRQRIVHVEAEPEFSEHGHLMGYTGIVQDVTDRRQAEDRIRHLANFDALTGLPNRLQLIWRTERALEHSRRLGHQVALLLIDLDRFKVINDTLVHGAGDDLLTEVARRLRSCVRHSDQVMEAGLETMASRSHRTLEAVGRLGGDEFIALLPEVGDERDAERVANRILDLMREPIFVSGQECFVTASVGIALSPRDGTSMADLLRNADVAMYSVKDSGRNNVALYSPSLSGKGREKLELESALHKALERNELVLHYQPKIDVRTNRMVGVEALMRWQRNGKLVPPADFIPLAEETNLIIPMSEWAIVEAARQARIWRDEFGFDESIAVNLPSIVFERTDLVEHIHAAVKHHDVPHRVIMLEITESRLMRAQESVMPTLHRLKAIGVEISIDDFGTGYSSLQYLPKLPIRELKIDREFVRPLEHQRESPIVVKAILALARELELRVIAEGVETARQVHELQNLGCSLMQGYYFSRPLPAEELSRWVRQTVLPGTAPWLTLAHG